jgi:4-hydroxy 2-oxovalerate aldolase
MKNVKILDCTLRDGGRIIDCKFSVHEIKGIINKLQKARIDIVEIGFLRDWRDTTYSGNSTFFTDIDQMIPFLPPKEPTTTYVAFVDYGIFDFDSLKTMNLNSITGIRVGFTQNDYIHKYDDLIRCLKKIKEKGYELYIQGVNSLNYTDKDMLNVVEMVNEVNPISFGIVDTYGAMYVDDVTRLYNLIDHNLEENISMDFHSHNNFQLSFSHAQEVIKLSRGVRNIIIDATLNGMGKGAGNLNTELITDFLVRKMAYNYDLDILFDTIDEYLHELHKKYHWGYSTEAMMSGIFESHPNNVIYLLQKYSLFTKDIKNILSMLDKQERQRYDYAKLEKLLQDYNDSKYDDHLEIDKLSVSFRDRDILLLVPGPTILSHREVIENYISQKDPIIITVNYISNNPNYYSFIANRRRYTDLQGNEDTTVIVSSNIAQKRKNEIVVSYHSLVSHNNKLFDNSLMMLLNLLGRLNVKYITIAGMDGFIKGKNNYFDDVFNVERHEDQFDIYNNEVSKMLSEYIARVSGTCVISLITPSIYEGIFKKK